MHDYTYLVRAINLATEVIIEQWHACARPLTALRRVQRNILPWMRETPSDTIVAVVYDKEGNICFRGIV